MRLLSDNFHRCVFPNFFFAVSVKLQAMIKMVRRIWAGHVLAPPLRRSVLQLPTLLLSKVSPSSNLFSGTTLDDTLSLVDKQRFVLSAMVTMCYFLTRLLPVLRTVLPQFRFNSNVFVSQIL